MTRGPAPKDPRTRQRTNKMATRAALVVAEELDTSRVPDMGVPEGEDWHPMTTAWWTDVWTSPMASQFLDADRHTLYRLLLIVQEFWMRPNMELSKEIDKAQQPFGLTPLDRRRLEWIVDNVPPPTKKLSADAPANVVPITSTADPRRSLL